MIETESKGNPSVCERTANEAGDSVRAEPVSITRWFFSLAAATACVAGLTTVVLIAQGRAAAGSADPFALKPVPQVIDEHEVTTDFGRQLFSRNCSSCHAQDLSGMPNQGANLVLSTFVRRRNDSQLMVFLRTGRMPTDRDSVLGLTMPPRGGNPDLDDAELADIVAYLRLVQHDREQPERKPIQMLGSIGAPRY